MMRVGVVAFTNAVPLAHGLEEVLPEAELVRLTPSRIADALGEGLLDIGLVPVASLAAHPEWNVLPGLGIASEGDVRSVLLVSKVAPEKITRLVLDPASRTSNQLARLWLWHQNGAAPETVSGPARLADRLDMGEATVAIGDEALFWNGDAASIDLGGAWTEWTGLPFVFAVWAGPHPTAALAPAFLRCYETNAARLGSLARSRAGGDAARAELLENYWSRSIRYRLGERENQGLMRYLSLGADAGYFEPVGKGRLHVQRA
ncbi:MAG TPA: menaquinone biosynthesis protein [Dongiaceae bacterium]|jgi:predicted solute-binding protein|nr:menaquinone biosynthesis protein [Dongiaceae bacterium]